MSTPFFGLYPLFRPKRLIIMSYAGVIGSNSFTTLGNGISQIGAVSPDYGRLIIYVNVNNSGYFGFKIFNVGWAYNNGANILNGGNPLSANVWYKFEVPAIPAVYYFWWMSSTSGVNSTLMQLVVIWEPAETPPSAGATD